MEVQPILSNHVASFVVLFSLFLNLGQDLMLFRLRKMQQLFRTQLFQVVYTFTCFRILMELSCSLSQGILSVGNMRHNIMVNKSWIVAANYWLLIVYWFSESVSFKMIKLRLVLIMLVQFMIKLFLQWVIAFHHNKSALMSIRIMRVFLLRLEVNFVDVRIDLLLIQPKLIEIKYFLIDIHWWLLS